MNTIKIAWLEDCTWCGCTELNVVTESGDENKLNLNDAVSCPECGAVGEIDCDDGCAFVAWAEPEPCQRCGVVSTRPNGEHYCHGDSQADSASKQNRYIYHYCGALEGQSATFSGIAQMTFKIITQADLDRLREAASTPDNKVSAILSLSYLGREHD